MDARQRGVVQRSEEYAILPVAFHPRFSFRNFTTRRSTSSLVSSLKDGNIIVPPTQLASLTFAASLNEEYF